MSSRSLLCCKDPTSAGEQAILDAGVKLFSRHGFDGVSMRQVASEARVSKSNIYHHFKSKEDLYLAIIRHSVEAVSAMIDTLAEGRGELDERLRDFTRSHLEHLFRNATTVRLVLREMLAGTSQLQKALVDQLVGGLIERLVGIFEKGQAAGVLRKGFDPGLCAFLVLGSNLFYFQTDRLRRFEPLNRFSQAPEVFSEQLTDLMLRGMLVDGRAQELPA